MHEHVSIARDDGVGIAHNFNINREYVFSVVEYMLSFRWGCYNLAQWLKQEVRPGNKSLKKKLKNVK